MLDNEIDFDWPDNQIGNKLELFADLLSCPICKDFFSNPQMLKCGHSFCSLCINKYFDKTINRKVSDVCPSCREKADLSDLRSNRILCAASDGFKSVQFDLKKTLTAERKVIAVLPMKTEQKQFSIYLPVTKRLPHFSFHGLAKDKVKKTIEKVFIDSKIKLRLDGEKETIERRFREFIHLHNSQIGATTPLSFEAVAQQINENEVLRDREIKKNSNTFNKIEKLKYGEVCSKYFLVLFVFETSNTKKK
jgi:hypothetical protein